MNQKEDEKTNTAGEPWNESQPFVNEECGDTMWDAVIKEAEERLEGITNMKDGGAQATCIHPTKL